MDVHKLMAVLLLVLLVMYVAGARGAGLWAGSVSLVPTIIGSGVNPVSCAGMSRMNTVFVEVLRTAVRAELVCPAIDFSATRSYRDRPEYAGNKCPQREHETRDTDEHNQDYIQDEAASSHLSHHKLFVAVSRPLSSWRN